MKDTVGYMRLSGHNAHAIKSMMAQVLTKEQMSGVQGLLPEEIDEDDDIEFERVKQQAPAHPQQPVATKSSSESYLGGFTSLIGGGLQSMKKTSSIID